MGWIQYRHTTGNYVITHQNDVCRSFVLPSQMIVAVAVTFDGVCLYYSNGEGGRPLRLCKLKSSTFTDYPSPFNGVFQIYESKFQHYDFISTWSHDPNDRFYVLERSLTVILYNRYLNFVDLLVEQIRIEAVNRVVVYEDQAAFMHADESFTLYTKERGASRYQYNCTCSARIPYFRETTEVRCICELTTIPQTHLFRVYLGVHMFIVYECGRGEYLIKNTDSGRLHRLIDVDEFKDIIKIKDSYYMIVTGSQTMGGFGHDTRPQFSKGFGYTHVLMIIK
jgi:hypothetical protein